MVNKNRRKDIKRSYDKNISSNIVIFEYNESKTRNIDSGINI
jgi:hypothetical protein